MMSAVTQSLVKELKGKVLVASPYAPLRARMLKNLEVSDNSVSEAKGGADVLLKLEQSDFATLLLDPRIEDLDLEELIATLRGRYPSLDVVLLEPDPISAKVAMTSTESALPGAQSLPVCARH